jgi:tetratricopeptide (TPR) repeat protein
MERKKIFVLDTNALLYDPTLIFAFPMADIIIPQVVLTELDRLKSSHPDKNLRFRGREVTRLLFELAEKGKLLDGVELDEGSKLKVVLFDPNKPYPSILNPKLSDDQILGVASQISWQYPEADTYLVTNDLNMLLKAQLIGIKIRRFRERLSAWQGIYRFMRSYQKTIISWSIGLFFLLIFTVILLQTGLINLGERENIPPPIAHELQAYQGVEEAYFKALKKNPNDVDAILGLANFYFQTQRYEQAIEMYERAQKLRPKDTTISLKIAESYFRLGTPEIALKELKEILKDDPHNLPALATIGNYYFDRKQYSKAITYYQKVLSLQPENNNVRTDMAIAFFNLGKVDDALNQLEIAIKNDPKHALAHYNRAVILWQGKGNLKEAKKEFENYLKLEPQGKLAQEAKARIQEINELLKKEEKT